MAPLPAPFWSISVRSGSFSRPLQAHIEEQNGDAITGHSDGRVARKYGEYPMPLLLSEIKKIPDPTAPA